MFQNCLVRKALYGLKQASRAWHDAISKVLLSLGFERSVNEPCVFLRIREGKIMITLYVDCVLIFTNDELD